MRLAGGRSLDQFSKQKAKWRVRLKSNYCIFTHQSNPGSDLVLVEHNLTDFCNLFHGEQHQKNFHDALASPSDLGVLAPDHFF